MKSVDGGGEEHKNSNEKKHNTIAYFKRYCKIKQITSQHVVDVKYGRNDMKYRFKAMANE